MTLIKTGNGITDIRGGFGGVYFHRDKSGLHCANKPRKIHRRTVSQNALRDAFTAARVLSKDNRIVSYLMYRYMNGLNINYPNAWTFPTGYIDPESKWYDEPLAYDGDGNTFAGSTSDAGTNFKAPLIFTNPIPLTCSAIRYDCDHRAFIITEIRIRIFYDSSYHLIYEGVFTDSLTVVSGFGNRNIERMEVSFLVTGGGRTQKIQEVAFYTLNNPLNNEPHVPVPFDYQIPHLQGP